MIHPALVTAALILAAPPAAAARTAPPQPPGWAVYGDVIIEVASPKDPASGGVALRLRAA